jgi:hypothetical protein
MTTDPTYPLDGYTPRIILVHVVVGIDDRPPHLLGKAIYDAFIDTDGGLMESEDGVCCVIQRPIWTRLEGHQGKDGGHPSCLDDLRRSLAKMGVGLTAIGEFERHSEVSPGPLVTVHIAGKEIVELSEGVTVTNRTPVNLRFEQGGRITVRPITEDDAWEQA